MSNKMFSSTAPGNQSMFIILINLDLNASTLDRLSKLSDKINVINYSVDQEKHSKFEYLNQRINDVDDRLGEVQEQSSKKFTVIREQIGKIQKQLDEEKQKSETLLEGKNYYIKMLETKVTERFEQESQVKLD
jgi:vacuolar-type H+-ATPase subunit I/STV1